MQKGGVVAVGASGLGFRLPVHPCDRSGFGKSQLGRRLKAVSTSRFCCETVFGLRCRVEGDVLQPRRAVEAMVDMPRIWLMVPPRWGDLGMFAGFKVVRSFGLRV